MRFVYLFVLLTFLGCQRKVVPQAPKEQLAVQDTLPKEMDLLRYPTERTLTTIALGSCSKHDEPQPFWSNIRKHRPDLWIWLGDNVYGDTENMSVLAKKYNAQKQREDYSEFAARTGIIGIWDDHDYGVNDGDRTYPKKKESQQLMLDFLDVPEDAPVRQREGAYQSFTFGPPGQRVKIILLDARYHREPLKKSSKRPGPRYHPDPDGMILGEQQWEWLEKELTNSDAQIHLIGSGIQFIPEEHFFEKWANFPAARTRFFDLIAKTQPNHLLLMSGDRHIAEVSQITWPGISTPITELTTSGLTHSWSKAHPEANQYRVGDLIIKKNYGLLRINWEKDNPTIFLEVRHADTDELLLRQKVYE